MSQETQRPQDVLLPGKVSRPPSQKPLPLCWALTADSREQQGGCSQEGAGCAAQGAGGNSQDLVRAEAGDAPAGCVPVHSLRVPAQGFHHEGGTGTPLNEAQEGDPVCCQTPRCLLASGVEPSGARTGARRRSRRQHSRALVVREVLEHPLVLRESRIGSSSCSSQATPPPPGMPPLCARLLSP